MKVRKRSGLALAAGLAVAMASIGGGAVAQDAGTVNIAVNPWTGSAANVAVVARLLEQELGYTVEEQLLAEQVSWQGFETGDVDAILEVWGHEDLVAQYVDQSGLAQHAGLMGVQGIIGWYVPGWMAEEYPEITTWEGLNQHAQLFRTSESGDKGQFLLGDPSYVSNDAAIIANLGLDFTVVTGGSEAALIESFRTATIQRTPLLAYFYEPQWAWSQSPLLEEPLVRVHLPEWTEGCDADPALVACDYPEYELYKVVRTEFAASGGPAAELIANFSWSNLDQATVSAFIDVEGLSADDAAARWLEENPETWAAWMPATE